MLFRSGVLRDWRVRLIDAGPGGAATTPTVLTARGPLSDDAAAADLLDRAPYRRSVSLAMPGRVWRLQAVPRRGHIQDLRSYGPWALLLGGCVVVTLLGLLLQSLADRGIAIQAEVRRKTAALAEANRQLIAARDAADEANTAKSRFLATMSHEIRTPLNGVIGMVDLLLLTSLDARQREYAGTVRDSGECLLSLINDILDLSKIGRASCRERVCHRV